MQDYRPIDCSLHDRYEAAAVLRRRVRVSWTDAEGGHRETDGVIRDVGAECGAEYMVLDTGARIRLDRIASFEEIAPGAA